MVSRASLAIIAVLSVPVAAQTTHSVTTFATTFVPDTLVIDAGDTVDWMWTGGTHTATEGLGPFPTGDEAFNGVLGASNPLVTVMFSNKFLFENPRTDHVYDYYCTPHFVQNQKGVITVSSPWENLGFDKSGTSGSPLLWGDGPLTDGSLNILTLENGFPNTTAILFVGLTAGNVPFKGGTLAPFPPLVQVGLGTDVTGTMVLPFLMPSGLSGVELFFQYGLSDPGATLGVSLSNAASAKGQ